MEKWVEIRKGGDFEELGRRLSVSPVIARILKNRNIEPDQMYDFLNQTTKDLYNPHLFKNMDHACTIILDKIREQKKIRIIGDYDIDGVCSTYILSRTLEEIERELLGSDLSHIDTCLPHRILDGYGLNKNLISHAIEEGIDTIITCDNGIAAAEEIEFAKTFGLTVIVTDHHEVPYHEENGEKIYELPMADAIVNQKQPDCTYPFRELCGAEIAFKMSQVLFEMAGVQRDSLQYLDIAAFATIGDVMPLIGENRIIVKYGLQRLLRTENVGMRALLNVCGLEDKDSLSPYHVGFVLGPCMNATGRLDTAENALKLLQCHNEREALQIAADLKSMNDQRKEMTEEQLACAIQVIDEKTVPDKILVVYLEECHESLAGIIAGRLRERYNRPAIVLTATEDGVKGSGRSIDEYDMHEHLLKCRELFSKFGGHRLAAGLSMSACDDLERKRVAEDLRVRLNQETTLSEEDLTEKVLIDMALPFSWLTKELIQELKLLEPCGMENRKPVFAARKVTFGGGRVFGKNRNVYKCMAKDDSGRNVDAVYFGDVDKFVQYFEEKGECNIIYYPEINEYQGRNTLQIVVQKYQ